MKGRKPKPTVLRIAQGNPGKRPLNKSEPKPNPGIPTCPAHLAGPAREEWDRIVIELSKMGLLSHADRAVVAAYCAAYGRWVAAEKLLEKGLVYKPEGGTLWKANPAVGIAHEALTLMRAYVSEIGLSPSSRSRIKVADQAPEDPMEAFLRDAAG